MEIKVVRIYDPVQPAGFRILVDKIWPRGMSKDKAKLDLWAKQIAPSPELRKWFNHEDAKFAEFSEKYLHELAANEEGPAFVQTVEQKLAKQDVLFLYGAKNVTHNHALVLKSFVTEQLKGE